MHINVETQTLYGVS